MSKKKDIHEVINEAFGTKVDKNVDNTKIVDWLDIGIASELRDKMNNYFGITTYTDEYTTMCAILDRLDSSVRYLNKNCSYPQTEEDFIIFMTFAYFVTNAVYSAFVALKLDIGAYTIEKYKYFKEVCTEHNLVLQDGNIISDTDFFRYIRSMILAHPFKTSQEKFLQVNKEIQCSPYVIANSRAYIRDELVGIQVYSTNKNRDFKQIMFKFSTLKEYIKCRYEMLRIIIQNYNDRINLLEGSYKKFRFNKNKAEIELLNDIIVLYKERNLDYNTFEQAIEHLDCVTTCKDNDIAVDTFRGVLKSQVTNVCSCIENLEYDRADNLIHDILRARPKLHNMSGYQLEKIYCNLENYRDIDDIDWGLNQVEDFYKAFAHKWVTIKSRDMSFDEIKLLVSVSCYMEWVDQNKRGNNNG